MYGNAAANHKSGKQQNVMRQTEPLTAFPLKI